MENGKDDRELIAVFFDYENIVYSLRNRFEQKANFEALIDKCKELGRVVAARAFADWSLPHISPALLYALQSSGFDLIFVPTGSTQVNAPRKNVADLYMAIHVMETLHTRPDVSTFVLLTGDRDFMPLVNTLQRYGKRVVAIGVDGSSSYYLTQAVDDFYYYSEVEEIFEDAPKRSKGRLTNIYDALVQTIKILQEKGKPATLAHLKPQMSELLGGFDESQYMDGNGRPFQKFKDFIMEARRRGMVQVIPRGSGMEVTINNKPNARPQIVTRPKAQESSIEDGPLTLEQAFDLLVHAVQSAQTEGKSFRASSIKNLMTRLQPGFSEGDIENGDTSYSRFSDFVRDAAKRELVEVRGTGPKMEIRPRRDTSPVNKSANNAPNNGEDTLYEEGDIRGALLDALRNYRHYPVSFLSLASHCHKWLEKNNIHLAETMTRTLLTETVELGLVGQSRRQDGKRQYTYQEDNTLINQFLDVAMGSTAQPPTAETLPPDTQYVPEQPERPEPTKREEKSRSTRPEREEKPRPSARPEPEPKPEPKPVAAKRNDSQPQAPLQQEEEFTEYTQLSETEEKQLMLDALRTCSSYPAPFMGILAHCRVVRDERQVYLPNGPLRELLSAATKAGLVRSVSPRNERPTRYDFFDSEEAVGIFMGDAPTPAVDTEPAAEAEEQENKKDSKEQKDETAAPALSEADAPAVTPEPAAVDETAARQLLVDALRTYDGYPVPFMKVLNHVCAVRDERETAESTDLLRGLLSESVRAGVLEVTSPRGIRPTLYAFTGDDNKITAYLGANSEETEAEVTAETSEPEPVAADEPEDTAIKAAAPPVDPAFQLLGQAVQTLLDNGKSTILRSVKQAMQKADGDFNEKNLTAENGKPYKRFKDFVEAGVAVGVVTLDQSGKSPRVYLPAEAAETEAGMEVVEEAAAPVEVKAETQAEEVPAAEALTLEDAFALLKQAVQAAADEGSTHRLASIRSRMKKLNPSFDVKNLVSAEGKPFAKLSDFMRAATKEGHIEMHGKGFSLEAHPISTE